MYDIKGGFINYILPLSRESDFGIFSGIYRISMKKSNWNMAEWKHGDSLKTPECLSTSVQLTSLKSLR